MARRALGSSIGAIAPGYPDSNVTYKGVQFQMYRTTGSPPARPPVSVLQAMNVGSVRMFSSANPRADYLTNAGTTAADFASDEAYIATLRAANIFPIVCIDMQASVSAAAFTEFVRDWGRAVGAGAYELGNEEASGFSYDGSSGTNWSRFLLAVEDACTVLHGFGRQCLLGAALDVNTNGLLSAARARWGTDWTPDNKPDGAAIHPYGQAGATYAQIDSLNMTTQRLQQARDSAHGNLPTSVPLWITEMGIGVAGNTNSTLVCLQDSVSCKTVGAQTLGDAAGASPPPWNVTVDAVTGFSAGGGSAYVFPLGKFSYAGIQTTGTKKLLGCHGGTAQSIAAGATIGSWQGATPASNTEQADIVTHIFEGAPGMGFANGLWARRNGRVSKANLYGAGGVGNTGLDLYLKNVGWFIGADYGAAPNGNWANQCGLLSAGLMSLPAGTWSGATFDATKRPSYDAYAAVAGGNPSAALA